MKTNLFHLPKEKQVELHSIVKIIVEMTQPEMIILFGSHARGDWVNDQYTEDGITYTPVFRTFSGHPFNSLIINNNFSNLGASKCFYVHQKETQFLWKYFSSSNSEG